VTDLTHQRLLECLNYDPETGVFTYRISRHYRQTVGAVAGANSGHGYLVIWIDAQKFYAHRLAWFYIHAAWPAKFLDHINGNPRDNRLANLREATQSQNLCNKAMQSNNKSGYKGVSWHKGARKWMAQIGGVGNERSYLGLFDDVEEAAQAYRDAAKAHHKEFARTE
jgi:hypothetical protein